MKNHVLTLILISLTLSVKAQFFVQSILSDLNQHPNNLGAYAASVGTLNAPTSYGTVLGLRFWDGGNSDWRTQLAFGTDNNFYFRQSTNSSGNSWSNWNKVWNSANLNRNDIDFNCKNLFTSGLIGIGTMDPQNTLSIKGTIGIYGNGLDGSTYQRTVIYSDVVNGLYFDAPLKPDGSGLPINFAWRGGAPKITFLPSGNILIGKTSQTNSSYKLDVAGKIRVDEVVVNSTGADFVFEAAYKLRSLSELEAFINANKHLPEIAPAQQMQDNGISAGEMQTKLLQKIEELTLYIIEQHNKLEAQSAINADLMKRITELEHKLQ